jgi:hypothetical protein
MAKRRGRTNKGEVRRVVYRTPSTSPERLDLNHLLCCSARDLFKEWYTTYKPPEIKHLEGQRLPFIKKEKFIRDVLKDISTSILKKIATDLHLLDTFGMYCNQHDDYVDMLVPRFMRLDSLPDTRVYPWSDTILNGSNTLSSGDLKRLHHRLIRYGAGLFTTLPADLVSYILTFLNPWSRFQLLSTCKCLSVFTSSFVKDRKVFFMNRRPICSRFDECYLDTQSGVLLNSYQ